MQRLNQDILSEFFSLDTPQGCSDCGTTDLYCTVFAIGSRRKTKRLCRPCRDKHIEDWRAYCDDRIKRRAKRR